MKLVVDVSSVVKTCLFAGKDKEFGTQVEFEGKSVQVNSAEYGIDNAINHIEKKLKFLSLAPRDLILVVEGKSSKALRTAMWDGYKADRGETAPEVNVEFGKARDGFVKTYVDLGAQACQQPGVEGDDVIAYLAQALPNCMIDSNDRDLQVLASDTAHAINGSNEIDGNGYGPFPARYITLYKALVGGKDNIKGARGFGPKAFLDLFCMWGEDGLDQMTNLILTRSLERLVEDVAQLPALQKIIDDMQGVYLGYDLAQLYPEKVNSFRNPLRWDIGMCRPAPAKPDPRLAKWYGKRKLVHAGNYAATMAWLEMHADKAPHVALDIETSSPMESDDWLELRKKRATKDELDARDLGVDVLGHKLTSMSVTLGDNDQYTLYFPVHHTETDGFKNVTSGQVLDVVKLIPQATPIVVQNASFELSVLHREWGAQWADNGWHGFLPNVHDTKIMASYVNENMKHSLKPMSAGLLKYEQVSYAEVTQGRKMDQLSATEAFDYGCDDTICTVALYNHFKVMCEIERTWVTYLEVETAPAYLNALRFNQGTAISMEELLAQEREDQEAFDGGWLVLQQYLIEKGWNGTVCPQVATATDIVSSFIKDAYAIVTGVERIKDEREAPDAFLDTKTHKPEKMVALLEADEALDPLLAACLRQALAGDVSGINQYLKLKFTGAPRFNLDSPPQVCRLMYETLGLPIRLCNKRTDKQRAEGAKRGNPRGDDLAVQYALQHDVKPGTQGYTVLKALQAMKVANTRRKLYYTPYKTVCHWTDGLVHSYLNQCAAVTRRYTESGPNKQQLPKHAKSTGVKPKFRRIFVPHHRRAVVVSMDFTGQELVVIAQMSQDPNLLACFIGDHKKDVHALTASGILAKKALARRVEQIWTLTGRTGTAPEDFVPLVMGWKTATYETFMGLKGTEWNTLYDTLRALGKKTNFTTEFGAMAPKLAETLLIDTDEAQEYIDAKFAAFPRVVEWKDEVTAELHRIGYTTTLMDARRHLADRLLSGNSYDIGGAERQGINFKIQGSACEQTKLAETRIWKSDLLYRYDARYIGPVHDELVFSVCIDDLVGFLTEAHAMVVAPYGGMTVPIVSEISFGLNYGEQTEVGASVVPGVILGAVGKLFPNEPANAPWRERMAA